MRIGLLGGSFNPAHDGHRYISLKALRLLQLQEIWWMVSPQNPLKPQKGMADLTRRVRHARLVAKHPKIIVTDLESRLGTRYTADTLPRVQTAFPGAPFVWLMGADNLQQLPAWDRWTDILRTMPVAVLARPSYSIKALSSKAAHRFAKARLSARKAPCLATACPPAWVFLRGGLHSESASRIRAAGQWHTETAERD